QIESRVSRKSKSKICWEVIMWYLVLRRPVKPREEWTVTLDQHLVWMKQQHEAGKILFSGPDAGSQARYLRYPRWIAARGREDRPKRSLHGGGVCGFRVDRVGSPPDHGRRAIYDRGIASSQIMQTSFASEETDMYDQNPGRRVIVFSLLLLLGLSA